jgi:hypothetical protein
MNPNSTQQPGGKIKGKDKREGEIIIRMSINQNLVLVGARRKRVRLSFLIIFASKITSFTNAPIWKNTRGCWHNINLSY